MSQTQSLRKKNAADNNSAQPLQRNRAKNDSEALDKKIDGAAAPDTEPLQKKAYRTAQDEPRLQTKLSVSTPGDSHEQEADRVADEVVSRSAAPAQEENKLNPGSTKPENNATNPQSLQTKISRMAEPAPATTETPQVETEAPTSAETATDNEQGVSAEVEQQIAGLRGQGAQLPEQVRTEMESQFNHDFSSVSIHTGGTADALCKQLSARAFTVGSDIFFASGEYAPDSQEGKRLLAHELTHVVQQGSGVTRQVMRVDTLPTTYSHREKGDVDTSEDLKKIRIKNLQVPRFKRSFYQAAAGGRFDWSNFSRDGVLSWKRNADTGGVARRTQQAQKWDTEVGPQSDSKVDALLTTSNRTEISGTYYYYFKYNSSNSYLIGTADSIKQRCRRPLWRANGTPCNFQVDHQVEYQTGGIDEHENMWLLDGSINMSCGPALSAEIISKVQDFVNYIQTRVANPPTSADDARSNFTVFHPISETSLEDYAQQLTAKEHFYTKDHIKNGDQLTALYAMTQDEINNSGMVNGSADNISIFPLDSGGYRHQFIRNPGETGYSLARNSIAEIRTKNFEILGVNFNSTTCQGDIRLRVPSQQLHSLNPKFPPPIDLDPIAIEPMDGVAWGGRYKKSDLKNKIVAALTHFPGLSPLEIVDVEMNTSGVCLLGAITPTLPLLNSSPISFAIDGDRLSVFKTFSAADIAVPSPLNVSGSSLTLGISTRDFFAQGTINFGIDGLGSGSVTASASAGFDSSTSLALSGQFNFDEKLFGQGAAAQVRVSYANEQWSIGGTLSIPEGKVPGIRSATINVDYSEAAGFAARGEAQLSVPGVDNGTIEITHNEEEGFVIGGSFNLSQGRGIRGGQISARVQEKPDGTGYAVTAHGEAQPDIPGINSNLIVDYNDGAFTAAVSADYARGMLSGRINAGVTNRTVNEDGTLADTASENNELVVYGGGELTIQIAPWLQGTAGVQFAPNGEITVLGRIEMPDDLEIFARQEINRSIFNIAVQAPIFPGVVAEIGGGLSATAGIGPGVIDQLALQIEYNPAHEEDTHITGDAHLNIPANAGLRLSVRAGIGLGIPLASVTGGLDIGGTLGIEGAAEAGVHVDWTPTTGLDITAELAVHAQPSFTFDIGGYVSVRALGASIYDNRWEFASYTFGSDYRFGIRLPIHYHEGEPFEISTDDIEFEVPDIDTEQLLSGLIERIA